MSENFWTWYQIYRVRYMNNLGSTNGRVVRNSGLAANSYNVCKPQDAVVVGPRIRALVIVHVALRKIAVV